MIWRVFGIFRTCVFCWVNVGSWWRELRPWCWWYLSASLVEETGSLFRGDRGLVVGGFSLQVVRLRWLSLNRSVSGRWCLTRRNVEQRVLHHQLLRQPEGLARPLGRLRVWFIEVVFKISQFFFRFLILGLRISECFQRTPSLLRGLRWAWLASPLPSVLACWLIDRFYFNNIFR